MTAPTDREISIAKQILTASGHVVLKAKSYQHAQERQRVAQALAEWETRERRSIQRWAYDELCPEIRSLRERVTFLYGAARAAGCTVEDLSGSGGGGVSG